MSPETRSHIEEMFRLWEAGDPVILAHIKAIQDKYNPAIEALQREITRSIY